MKTRIAEFPKHPLPQIPQKPQQARVQPPRVYVYERQQWEYRVVTKNVADEPTLSEGEKMRAALRSAVPPDATETISFHSTTDDATFDRSTMRIVALSDQHGHLPAIPPCDLLIVAGDVCPDRFGPFLAMHAPDQQKLWFDRHVRPWLAEAPAMHKILTWGNHDWCGQAHLFSADAAFGPEAKVVQILVDRATSLPFDGGSISVWASPWSNRFLNWAFMAAPEHLEALYAQIPEGIDTLVSHQPPYGYGDRCRDIISGRTQHLGSRELLTAIDRVRPKLVICGHIHDGYGGSDYKGIPIYNVSVVDEQYRPVHPPTVIDLPLPARARKRR